MYFPHSKNLSVCVFIWICHCIEPSANYYSFIWTVESEFIICFQYKTISNNNNKKFGLLLLLLFFSTLNQEYSVNREKTDKYIQNWAFFFVSFFFLLFDLSTFFCYGLYIGPWRKVLEQNTNKRERDIVELERKEKEKDYFLQQVFFSQYENPNGTKGRKFSLLLWIKKKRIGKKNISITLQIVEHTTSNMQYTFFNR